MTDKTSEPEVAEQVTKPAVSRRKKVVTIIVATTLVIVLLVSSLMAYGYATSPEAVRSPAFEHYHFRMQVVVDGQPENFGADAYQEPYTKDLCTADLTDTPIHFHDGKDQFVHIHWANITGGMVMKYYGWNFIGGQDSVLGYKLNELPKVGKLGIHGALLPEVKDGANYYVYVGDENGYEEKSFDDWVNQTHEEFFGTPSNVPKGDPAELSWLKELFLPSAYAETSHTGGHSSVESEEQKLTRINNLLGNVVIFAQADKPTDEQVKERFANLVPLGESTCGG